MSRPNERLVATLEAPRPITGANWRIMRARAVHIAREHRRYLHEFGRLPHCPLDRLEWAPFERYLRANESDIDPWASKTGGYPTTHLSDTYIANRLGHTSTTSISICRRRGHVDRRSAERWADKLGAHPAEIWPDYWFDVGPSDDEAVSAA